jgi:hypothetical protein
MMNVLIDGVEHPISAEPDTSLGAVLAQVDAALAARERMIVSVNIDGKAISPEALGAEVSRHVGSMQRVLVQSEATAVLADTELARVEQQLPVLSQTVRDVATLFQLGKTADGLDGCRRTTDIWMGIVASERRVADALRLALDEFEVGGKPIEAHRAELNRFLHEALEAMERGDYVLLGDLFEHELAPRLDVELTIVNELRRSLASDRS